MAKTIAIEAAKAYSTTMNLVSKRKNHKYNNKAVQSSKTQQPRGRISYKKVEAIIFLKTVILMYTGCNKKGQIVKICIATSSYQMGGPHKRSIQQTKYIMMKIMVFIR